MTAQMLAPAAVLVLWSLIVLFWMALTRFPALSKMGVNVANAEPGVRGVDSEDKLPPSVNWKSHNYTHLMEQPTIFYPTVVILAMTGASGTDVLLAWVYVGLRIAHSLWQATVNKVSIRFSLFLISTITLVALAVRAVMATLLADPGAL